METQTSVRPGVSMALRQVRRVLYAQMALTRVHFARRTPIVVQVVPALVVVQVVPAPVLSPRLMPCWRYHWQVVVGTMILRTWSRMAMSIRQLQMPMPRICRT